jgi:hypothetical protein
MAPVSRRGHADGGRANRTKAARGNGDEHDLDDLDAALLQIFLARRVIRLDNALDILTTLVDVTGNISTPGLAPPGLTLDSGTPVDQDTFEEAVGRVNAAIHDFDFEIRKSLSQATGDPLWAIVFFPGVLRVDFR